MSKAKLVEEKLHYTDKYIVFDSSCTFNTFTYKIKATHFASRYSAFINMVRSQLPKHVADLYEFYNIINDTYIDSYKNTLKLVDDLLRLREVTLLKKGRHPVAKAAMHIRNGGVEIDFMFIPHELIIEPEQV